MTTNKVKTQPRSQQAKRIAAAWLVLLPVGGLALILSPIQAQSAYGDDGDTSPIEQSDIISGDLSLHDIRMEGLRVFSQARTKADGLGDGPINPYDKVSPGGRPTLQNNGTFLRINGLDSTACVECHTFLSSTTVPPELAIGGVGTMSQSAFPNVIDPDIDDSENNGYARIEGRFINPPFNFGTGGVELLGKEMTQDLQDIANGLEDGASAELITHGVSFGTLHRDVNGALDLSEVEGVDDDLVVRPFGRKGENASVRSFDQGALMFHHGIQPVEIVGEDVDADGDGVVNEATVGEVSALHIYQLSLPRPREEQDLSEQALAGRQLFQAVGCASCHIPKLETYSKHLRLSFPEVDTDPFANEYFSLNLTREFPGFDANDQDGVTVPLYADLKHHDMGPGLAEANGDAMFTTARLWGIADTAPYLHDGRAPDLQTAIELHGGEAQAVRDAFVALSSDDQLAILEFLRTLRTPESPNADLFIDENDEDDHGGHHHDRPPRRWHWWR